MNPILQSTRPRFASERGPEYGTGIGRTAPDPIAVPWSGVRRRKRGVFFATLYAAFGVVVFVLAAGIGVPI